MKLLSFIIPVYQNAGSIATLSNLIDELMKLKHQDMDYELIFINDGSSDNSWNEIKECAEVNSRIKAISLSRNFGQVPSIIAGAQHATGDAAVIMSADLQDPVSLVSEMIAAWKDAAQIVICHRNEREDSFISRLGSSVFYKFMKIANPSMPEGGFDFVFLDKKALKIFASFDERNRFFQGDILWMGFNVRFIPYKRESRKVGKSQWTLSKKLKYLIDGSLNTSYAPIRFMSVLGMSLALIGFIYACVVVYARLANQTPFEGYAPIVILLLVIGGVIMLMLGIIGEYLWRIYDETRKRPPFIIDEKIGHW